MGIIIIIPKFVLYITSVGESWNAEILREVLKLTDAIYHHVVCTQHSRQKGGWMTRYRALIAVGRHVFWTAKRIGVCHTRYGIPAAGSLIATPEIKILTADTAALGELAASTAVDPPE